MSKKFTITFETADHVTGDDINFLLTTLLNDYCALREPVEHYVANRYSEHTEQFRGSKIASLRRLLQLAHDLNCSKEISTQ
jgi:hypothetical protein